MKYIYFITYFLKQGYGFGLGNAQVIRNKKIENIEELQEIEEIIKKDCNVNDATIINYKLLRKEGGEEWIKHIM